MVEQLRVMLPPPPGINATYKVGRGRFYKAPCAAKWQEDAILLLRAAGFRPHAAGVYWLDVLCVVYTAGLDVDAPAKLVLDVLSTALDIDDKWVAHIGMVKIPADRDGQYLELFATIRPVADAAEWAYLSRQLLERADGERPTAA